MTGPDTPGGDRGLVARAARITPREVFAVFCALGVLDLAAVALGWHVVALASKPLLMPTLALWAARQGAPRGLAAALLCGFGGDVLLEVGGTAAFLLGMGCFAAGHVCYLRLFARRGALTGGRARYAAYGALWAVMVVLLWPGLDPGMRGPVAVYSLLLTTMAAGAYGLGRIAAAGGALFLLSDTLIATGIADWPQPPGHDFWIMLTYLAAQALLAAGVLGTGPAGATLARAPRESPAYGGTAPAPRPGTSS
jgi:uncharacterized membrane protein YhhN